MTRPVRPGVPSGREAVERRLHAGLDALGQTLDPATRTRLLDYLDELVRWNRAYNLTAVATPEAMVERHLLDSLTLRPFLCGRRIVDAGTGAGLPGLVLAVAEPAREFLLVDSNGKKIRFLRHVARRLELDNVQPVQARLEAPGAAPVPDEIVARALAPLGRLVEWTAAWLAGGARLLAMKGRLDAAERCALPDAYNVEVHPLTRPGQREARCVAIVTQGDRH